MIRAVLDTNVLTRVAASPSGPAAEVFERLQSGHLLVSSAPLLMELARVLSYERVRRLHGLDDVAINAFVNRIERASLIVTLPSRLPRVVPHDLDDDVVVATAVAGRAGFLCTWNRHLCHDDVVAYCEARSIQVVDDPELLRRL